MYWKELEFEEQMPIICGFDTRTNPWGTAISSGYITLLMTQRTDIGE